MGGRFRRLEFDRQAQSDAKRATEYGEAVRDTNYFFLQAEQARMWGDHERALRMYTRTLTEDRSRVVAWVGQVQMLVQLEECREGRLWADKALEIFPNNGELLAAKAQSCIRMGDDRVAMACTDGSLSCSGSSAWRWIVRGEVLLARKQGHHRDCFERAATETDFGWFDHLIIAEVLAHYHHPAAALQNVQSAIAMQPGHGYGWFVQGQYQQMLGWMAAAADSFKHCLEIAPEYRPAQLAFEQLAGEPIINRVFRWLKFRKYR
jgi:tetratricopeptide (TPR) repeat protein